MAVNRKNVLDLFDRLPEQAKQSLYDYLQFLSDRYRPAEAETPLSAERIRQIKQAYLMEFQQFEEKHGSLEALIQKESKTDTERNDLDDWLVFLQQLQKFEKEYSQHLE